MSTTNHTAGNTLLSRTECSALRGIAILGIFLHNYLHWLKPMVKENEYLFHQSNVDRMQELLLSPSWDLPLQMFSFFGHYGVPVFLFLSGYGLVLKYERGAKPRFMPFMKTHFMKLFPMMMLGFTVFAMIDWMTPMRHSWTWADIIAQLTMTINLFPHPDRIIWPGPYWFFGLMMQLYLIYIVAIHGRSNKVLLGIIALCWAMQTMCFDEPTGELLNRLRYNSIGGMLPFGMGVIAARMPWSHNLTRIQWVAMLAVSLLLTITMSLCFHTWLWVPAMVVILNTSFIKSLPAKGLQIFNHLGILSAAIFVCHPITRKLFIPISRRGDIPDGLVMYIVATLMLAYLFKVAIDKIHNA